MKRALFSLFALIVLVGSNFGCAQTRQIGCGEGCNGGCSQCGLQTAVGDAVDAYGQGIADSRGVIRGQDGRRGGNAGRRAGPSHEECCALQRNYYGPQGPPTATVTYPYYTTRGPRDFLMAQPFSIGP